MIHLKIRDTLNGEVHLRVDNSVAPVVMPARQIPILIRPKLREELVRLTQPGVITKQHTSRTYDVQTEGGTVLTRNRQFIRTTHHHSSDSRLSLSVKHPAHTQNIQKSSRSPVTDQSQTENNPDSETSLITTTRSDRISRPVQRLGL